MACNSKLLAAPGSVTYTYDEAGRLKAVANSNGVTTSYSLDAPGNRKSVTVVVVILPSVPTGLTATAISSSQINLAWTASTDTGGPGVAGYQIYRGGTQVATSTSTSYSDTGLSPATGYTYNVAAYDSATPAKVSGQSSPASATTLPSTVTENATVTQGVDNIGGGLYKYGFFTTLAGSINPTKLSNGIQSYYTFGDLVGGSQPGGRLIIQGFTADPTASWLVSAARSTTVLSVSSATYSYTSGTATWVWTTEFGFTGPGNVAVQVIHH